MKCIVLSGALCYSALQGTVQFCFTLDRIPSGRRRWLDTKGKKISALKLYTGWTVRHICSLSDDKELISQQAELYISVAIKPNSLNMIHAVNFRPNTMRAWFETEAMHVGFGEDKWHWHSFLAEHFELSCKCFLNTLETKIDSVNFNNFRISSENINQLQIANKETGINLKHFYRNQ
jgi:hypothetical protein